jgi:hypothetical protein
VGAGGKRRHAVAIADASIREPVALGCRRSMRPESPKFSGMLSDFDELVGMMNSHMVGLPGPNRDSAAEIRDRDRRMRGNRNANRLAVVGIVIAAAFVFILWRMQLLH